VAGGRQVWAVFRAVHLARATPLARFGAEPHAFDRGCNATGPEFALMPLRERADCPNGAAPTRRQPPHRFAIDTAKRGDVNRRPARESGPAGSAKRSCSWMAFRGEHRREKRDARAGVSGADQIRQRMRRTGDEASPPDRSGPTSTAQMHPRPQRGAQPNVARDHQSEPACFTNARDVEAKANPVRCVIVPKHHARAAARQARNGADRVAQTFQIREQPDWRKPPATRGCGISPDEKFRIHFRSPSARLWSSSIRNAMPRSDAPAGKSRAPPWPLR
jgi:hypothetical protein